MQRAFEVHFTRRILFYAEKNNICVLLKAWWRLAAESGRENPLDVGPARRRVDVQGEMGQRGRVSPEEVLRGRLGQGERRQGQKRRIAT